ncbi:MAG TPA: carbamoyl phosphate synthase large subunit, partial [Dehalococcoidia bacterium]|nr:carbamoyl phosphate synthase large subunit [Dehalococcoidia bacterium]
ALQVANEIKYPVLVRPSYVLGGRAMEIVQTPEELQRYMKDALEAGEGRKVSIDKYFVGKEVEVDAVCDGDSVLIPGIMEHVERAGVHSGDSMAIYPGLTLTKQEIATITDYTTRIGKSLNIKGLMNIQYVIVGGNTYRSPGSITEDTAEYEKTEIFVIEVNPRSSRTIPFISKVTGVPMVNLAVKTMLGKQLTDMGYGTGLFSANGIVGVKAPVFSMSKLTGVDTYLGPEMKSTGEVMGIDHDFESAISKALISANLRLPEKGSILLSISDEDKKQSGRLIQNLVDAGYDLFATEGTASLISELGKKVVAIPKRLNEGHPNVVDVIVNGTVNAVVNTITGNGSAVQDGFHIRRAAVEKRIPCFTSIDTATAAAESLTSEGPNYNVKSMLEYIRAPQGESHNAK